MSVDARTTSYGAPAYAALVDAVAELKDGSPLRQVRVVVATDRIGVNARRALARGAAGGPGVAALQVCTVRRLAEQLAGLRLARQGRRPLTSPVLAAVVRDVLIRQPGLFAPVARHPATVLAVAAAHRTLRVLAEEELAGLGVELPMVRDVVRLHGLVREAWRAAFFDEVDLLTEALDVDLDATPTVLFLPQDLDRAELALLHRVAALAPLLVLAGVTGDPRADEPVLAPWGLAAGPQDEPLAAKVVTATDPDDEVRWVVRAVVEACADRPGHRVAVLHGSANPYARLLHDHLDRAGLIVNGRGVRPTYELRAGRAARRLFGLLDDGLRRDAVLGFLADAPVRWAGRRVPSSRWERLSRTAGVVGGGDWDRVGALRDRRLAEAAAERTGKEPQEWLADRHQREADDSRDLYDFVTSVRGRLETLDGAATWAEMSELAGALWTDLLGEPRDWQQPQESRAAARVLAVLSGAHALDAVPGAPSLAALRDLLELELADDLDRVGKAGHGVHVAPVSEAVGLDVDSVFVVGLAEGLLPPRTGEDPLLPDEVRETTGGALLSTRERLDRQHRQVLAAFAAAADGAVATYPRGDLRRGGGRVPSRWLLPTLRFLTGDPGLQATDEAPPDGVRIVELASYGQALEQSATPANEQEWQQRHLAAVRRAGRDVAAEFAHRPAAALAAEATRARRSGALTRFDGNLAGVDVPDPTAGKPVAPTALEAWTACPHAYFVRHLLRVSPVEEPEEVLRIGPAQKGTVLHEALDDWLQAEIGAGRVPPPGTPWPPSARQRLRDAGEAACDKAERDGLTGYPLLWEQDKAAMLADLDAFLDADDHRRADRSLTPVDTELPFGIRGTDPVEIDLGDGRVLRLKGKADRVDRSPSGLVAVDYKTGSAKPYQGLSAEDPTSRGSKFQLPVYALAAGKVHGDTLPVHAEYWFNSRRARFQTVGYDVDDAVLATTVQALRVVVNGLRAGLFPARPKPAGQSWDCDACALVGDASVRRRWAAKAGDAVLADYRTLIGADDA